MVAYSFKRQFREPILVGSKQQTIRADRKRHARPGEALQLYTGMRTRQCELIGRAVCSEVVPVRIGVEGRWLEVGGIRWNDFALLDNFSRQDGFADWPELIGFWRTEHPDTPMFSGVLIRWSDFAP